MATSHLAKVSDGSITLPLDMQESLGLSEDGYLLLHVEGGRLIGDAVAGATSGNVRERTLAEKLASIDRLAGSMPELRGCVEELIEERKHDRW